MKATRKVIRGYAAVWGDLARRPDGWEQVKRGAFADTVAKINAGTPLPMQWDHQSQGFFAAAKIPVAAIVEAQEDKFGLLIKAYPHNSQDANELIEAIESRTIPGLSIAFPTETAEYEDMPKLGRRVLVRAELVEISAVNHPAYHATRVWVENEEYDDGRPGPAIAQPAATMPAAQGEVT